MKMFVTGGAGFIGANFILYWLKKYPQDSIVNFDKLTYAGNLENLKEAEKNVNYTFVKEDICNKEAVLKAMQGADIIINFAAESHVDRSIMDPTDFIKTNVLGTQVLLDAALDKKVGLFYQIGTDEVFGSLSLDSTEKFSEKSSYNPRSPYAASKASADHLVRAYYHTYGLPIKISNCSNNFGPYQFPEKMIPLAITNVIEKKKIPIYGDGLYVRDWLYVEDHCRAMDAIIHKGRIGETYCIGGLTQDISNLEVARKILKFLGKDESYIEFVKDRPGHDRKYAVDWSKIKQELGWEPLHNFDEWLALTIKWYSENQWWWEDIKNGSYKEYYIKQYGKNE